MLKIKEISKISKMYKKVSNIGVGNKRGCCYTWLISNTIIFIHFFTRR